MVRCAIPRSLAPRTEVPTGLREQGQASRWRQCVMTADYPTTELPCLPPPPRHRRQYRRRPRHADGRRRRGARARAMPTCCASCCRARSSTSAIRPIAGANLPDGGLEGYDGVAITGSALNVYDAGRRSTADRAGARRCSTADAAVRQLLGPAGDHGRGRRQRARNPKGREIGFGRRIALTAAGRGHPMYRRQGRGVRCRHGASRRGRDRWRPARRCWRRTRIRRAGGRDRGQRRGRLGHAISSGIFARRHGGDRAPLRQAADRGGLLRRRGGARRLCGRTSRRSTAIPTTSRSPGATASTRPCSTGASARPRSRTGSTHQVLPTRGEARTRVIRESMDFPDRHVVVTGGTGALGIAVVGALIEAGAHLPCALSQRGRGAAFSASRAANG